MTPPDAPSGPDLEAYHRSLSAELLAVKDRIRHLVKHWSTDGEHKEAALRTVLRRQLPEVFHIGRGFIVTPAATSTQIDVMVIDSRVPTLFRDGDLFIVAPDAVRALIEVKTSLPSQSEVRDAVAKLRTAATICEHRTPGGVWTGLFIYDSNSADATHKRILCGLKSGTDSKDYALNCVAAGSDMFVRWWRVEDDPSSRNVFPGQPQWRSYQLQGLAPAYFLGNLIAHVAAGHVAENQTLWFPLASRRGKESHGHFEMTLQDTEPQTCASKP